MNVTNGNSIKERTCGCMAPFRLHDESAPTVQILESPEPTESLLALLAYRFPRVSKATGANRENVRIRFRLNTTLDLMRITAEGVAECDFLNADEKGVLDMLRQVSEGSYMTHLSLGYGLPYVKAQNFGHAKKLLDYFCGRMVKWGLAKFGEGTREWRILDLLQSIKSNIEAGDVALAQLDVNITEFQRLAVPYDQIGLCGYSLKFEVEGEFVLYDIREIVGLWTPIGAPAEIGPTLANMPTLLGRLHKYIG